jgi:hypothetical protein
MGRQPIFIARNRNGELNWTSPRGVEG